MIVQGLYYESDDPSFVATVVKMIDHSFGWRADGQSWRVRRTRVNALGESSVTLSHVARVACRGTDGQMRHFGFSKILGTQYLFCGEE